MQNQVSDNNIEKKKILWLSILQGWSILLVILGHISLDDFPQSLNLSIGMAIHNVIYAFVMPLFMFISGFLLYLTRIKKSSPVVSTYKNKFKRLYIPLFTMVFSLCCIKYIYELIMNQPMELSPTYLINYFILYRDVPLVSLWFLITLISTIALYPLFKLADTRKLYEMILLLFCLIIYYYPLKTNIFQLHKVCTLLLFFYSGILICKYQFYKYLDSILFFIISSATFICLNILYLHYGIAVPSIALAASGILFSICLCMNLSKYIPSTFRTFRNYYYQIYLLSLFFQIAWLYISESLDASFWTSCIISILLGLYIPVLISKLILKSDNKYIKMIVGL